MQPSLVGWDNEDLVIFLSSHEVPSCQVLPCSDHWPFQRLDPNLAIGVDSNYDSVTTFPSQSDARHSPPNCCVLLGWIDLRRARNVANIAYGASMG